MRLILRELDGADSGEYANVSAEIARRHLLVGQFEQALALLQPLGDSALKRYGADDPRTLNIVTKRALAMFGAGRADAATQSALIAVDAAWARKDDAGPYGPPATWFALAHSFALSGDRARAAAELDRIDALGAKPDVWLRAHVHGLRAELATDGEIALRHREQGWTLLRDSTGSTHPQTARAALAYAAALRNGGHGDQAAPIEAQAWPVFDHAFPADSAFRQRLHAAR